MDEIVLLVIVLAPVSVPRGAVWQNLPLRVSGAYLKSIATRQWSSLEAGVFMETYH